MLVAPQRLVISRRHRNAFRRTQRELARRGKFYFDPGCVSLSGAVGSLSRENGLAARRWDVPRHVPDQLSLYVSAEIPRISPRTTWRASVKPSWLEFPPIGDLACAGVPTNYGGDSRPPRGGVGAAPLMLRIFGRTVQSLRPGPAPKRGARVWRQPQAGHRQAGRDTAAQRKV